MQEERKYLPIHWFLRGNQILQHSAVNASLYKVCSTHPKRFPNRGQSGNLNLTESNLNGSLNFFVRVKSWKEYFNPSWSTSSQSN